MSSRYGYHDEDPALDLINKLKLLEDKLREIIHSFPDRYDVEQRQQRNLYKDLHYTKYMKLKFQAESWLLKHGQHVKYDEAQRNIVDALEYTNNLVQSRGETLFWMAQMCMDLASKIAKTWGETTQTPRTQNPCNPYFIMHAV